MLSLSLWLESVVSVFFGSGWDKIFDAGVSHNGRFFFNGGRACRRRARSQRPMEWKEKAVREDQ